MNSATLAGALFAGGWFVFFDGVVTQTRLLRLPTPTLVDWLPGAVATLGFALMVAMPADVLMHLDTTTYTINARAQHCATCGLFVATTVGFSSIMLAVALAQTRYLDNVSALVRASSDYSAWPAVAALVQSSAIMASGVVLLLRRLNWR